MTDSSISNYKLSIYRCFVSLGVFFGGAQLVLAGNLTASFQHGSKSMSSEWGATDSQFEMGVVVDGQYEGWPVLLSSGIFYSSASESEGENSNEGRTTEVHLGVKKIFTSPSVKRLYAYLGGGIANISAEYDYSEEVAGFLGIKETVTTSKVDDAVGYWAELGFGWCFAEKYNAGLYYKKSAAAGRYLELGGSHFGFNMGYNF